MVKVDRSIDVKLLWDLKALSHPSEVTVAAHFLDKDSACNKQANHRAPKRPWEDS